MTCFCINEKLRYQEIIKEKLRLYREVKEIKEGETGVRVLLSQGEGGYENEQDS